jgi:hypothetical protein
VEYVLTNHSARTATACHVEFIQTVSNGEARRSGLGQDYYSHMVLQALDPFHKSNVLEPNETRRVTYDLPTTRGLTNRSVAVRVVAVVYDAKGESYPDPSVADGFLHNLNLAKTRMDRGLIDSQGTLQSLEQLLTVEHAAAKQHAVRTK